MLFYRLIYFACIIVCTVQLALSDDVVNRSDNGYKLVLNKLKTLDFEIAENMAVTKLQLNSILYHIQNLTEVTLALSQLNSDSAKTLAIVPTSCSDISYKTSGVYLINPERGSRDPFMVRCDQEYEGGGWAVIQNRFNGSVNFLRPWQEYKDGFGHLDGEFWLGLKKVHQMTYGTPHELHVLLEDFEGTRAVAKYSEFAIGSEYERFKISKLGAYSGTAGDSLSYHNNSKFATIDRDYNGCAAEFNGAWWYVNCHQSNLNGLYLKGKTSRTGMCWEKFRGFSYSLKVSRIMIRSLI